MGIDPATYLARLVSETPELADAHQRHLDEQGGLLPHVLMGDIARLVIEVAGSSHETDWLDRLLLQFESGLSLGSKDVAELIAVSFVEMLCDEHKALQQLLPRMGPALRQELQSICGK